MNKENKIKYVNETEDYLEKNNVYEIFEDLMKQLIINKPENPKSFLKDYLKNPKGKFIFLIGPPGSKIREIALQLSVHFESTVVSVGDLLIKEVNKKTEIGLRIEEDINNLLYVPDNIIVEILSEHLKGLNTKKNIIVEGFPKTIYQSKYILEKGIIPGAVIVLNFLNQDCINFSIQKTKEIDNEIFEDLTEEEKIKKANDYYQQYNSNLDGIKKIFSNNLFEIDGNDNNLIDNLARILKFKMNLNSPKKSFKILLIGQEDKDLNNMANQIKKNFGLIHVSVNSLLNDQIYNKTEVGKEILFQKENSEEIDKELVCGLINNRLKKSDCKIHGFILQGLINSKEKIKILKDLKINFNFVFILNKNVENIKNLEKWKEFKEYILNNYPKESINLDLNQSTENLIRTINFNFENYN